MRPKLANPDPKVRKVLTLEEIHRIDKRLSHLSKLFHHSVIEDQHGVVRWYENTPVKRLWNGANVEGSPEEKIKFSMMLGMSCSRFLRLHDEDIDHIIEKYPLDEWILLI